MIRKGFVSLRLVAWVTAMVLAIGAATAWSPPDATADPAPYASAAQLTVDNYVHDTAPWVNVNRHFGAAIRTGRIVPVTPNPAWNVGDTLAGGGVYMVSGDWPGWARSIDGGTRFEAAVSGTPYSKNMCGGYDATWYYKSGEQAWAGMCTAAIGDSSKNREWQEVSPPSSLLMFQGATASSGREVASGPVPSSMNMDELADTCRGPANQTGCAKSIVYTGNDLWSFFSPDAGRQWFRFTPQCEMKQLVGWGAIAADGGLGSTANRAGHVVAIAANWTAGGVQKEASGCGTPDGMECAIRTVAWTEDIGPELAESMKGTRITADAWMSKSRTERAGGGGADLGADFTANDWAAKAKWRYASINNLPAPAAIGGTCRVEELSLQATKLPGVDVEASVPPSTCKADIDSRCHGRRAQTKLIGSPTGDTPIDRSAWCRKATDANCTCKTGATGKCRYANPSSAMIDPRNGWAYITSDVGLLSSPNGGRHWIRQGGAPASNPADVFKKPDPTLTTPTADAYVSDAGQLGAKLFTKQFHCTTDDPTCSADPSAQNSLDLNSNSARIAFVGRMSLAFTPCATPLYYAANDGMPPRQRGHLVATIPVEWLANDGQDPAGLPKYRRVSSVFMAAQRANCEATQPEPPPGALEFWDTAHLELKAAVDAHPDLNQDYNLRARTYFDASQPKLLQNLHAARGLPLRYTAAAVAPSDPRVLWAFSHGYKPSERADPAAVPTSFVGPAGHLLWRSINGGASWHIALPGGGPYPAKTLRPGGGLVFVRVPELSVAPTNPHKLLLSDTSKFASGSGADDAWMVEPVPPEHVLPSGQSPVASCSQCLDQSACANTCNLNNIQTGVLAGCDRQKHTRDVCTHNGGTIGVGDGTYCFLSKNLLGTTMTGQVLESSTSDLLACASIAKVSTGMVFTHDINNNLSFCSAISPAQEAQVQASEWYTPLNPAPGLKVIQGPADQQTSLLYKTTVPCVPCGSDGVPIPPAPAGTGPTACCVKWSNASAKEAGELACVDGYTHRRLTSSRGAAGSPDYSNAILPALYSPIASTAPAIAVAGDDGNSSVGGIRPAPGPASAPFDVLAFAADKATSALWMLTSGEYGAGIPFFPAKDTADLAAAEAVTETSDPVAKAAYASAKMGYLVLRQVDIANGLSPQALTAAQVSQPLIFPHEAYVVGPNAVTVKDASGADVKKYQKNFSTMSRLAGMGNIIEGYSIPRLLIHQNHVLVASPGLGVVLVPKDSLKPGPAEQSLVTSAKARYVKFDSNGATVGSGVCVADIEVVGESIYAVVAQPASPIVNSCAPVSAGLYRADSLYDANSTFKLIVQFKNPHSVEWIPHAADGAGRLAVADWSAAGATPLVADPTSAAATTTVTGGGLWSCNIAKLLDPSDATGCHFVVQGDGIVDLAAGFHNAPMTQAKRVKSGVVFGARAKHPASTVDTTNGYMNPGAASTGPSPGVFSVNLQSLEAETATPDMSDPTGQMSKNPLCRLSKAQGKATLPQCDVLSGEQVGAATGAVTGAVRAVYNLTGLATGDLQSYGVAQSSDGGQGSYWLPGPPKALVPSAAPAATPLLPSLGPQLPQLPSYSSCTSSSPCLHELRSLHLILSGACSNSENCLPQSPNSMWLPKANDMAMGTGVFRLPLERVRNDYAGLHAFNAAVKLSSIWWSSDIAGPAEPATPAPNVTNHWTATAAFDGTAPDPLGWARVSLHLSAAPPASAAPITWTLNGRPLIGAWSADKTVFWSATANIISGTNDLQASCPGAPQDCQANLNNIVFLRAPVEEALPAAVGTSDLSPTAVADFWFDTRSEVSLRQGVWALVELANGSIPTMLRWNGGPWLPVTDGIKVTGTGNPPGSPAIFRVPVRADALRHGSNLLELKVAPCIGAACFPRAGILSARLVREASDDEDLCLASPEVCGNNLDDDCNGETDERGDALCDGPDLDGCANGHPTCIGGGCLGDVNQQSLPQTAAGLSMLVEKIEGIYSDGSVVVQPFADSSIHIGRLLTTGGTIAALSIELPQSFDTKLVELVIRGTPGGARLPWPGYEATNGREVRLRSTSADNDRDLHLVFANGSTTVTQGKPMLLLIDPAPNASSPQSVYECIDGTLTFPSHLIARDLCSFSNMDCTAPGSACDVGPDDDPVWGDQDGCASGHFLQPAFGAPICLGDWPVSPTAQLPAELEVTVTGISYLWGGTNAPTPGPAMGPTKVLIRQGLSTGTPLFNTLLAATDSKPLHGVRLHLQANSASVYFDLPTGWQPAKVKSGPNDNGEVLDLLLDQPTVLASPHSMAMLAASDLQPDWSATYQCGPNDTTVPPRIWVRLVP